MQSYQFISELHSEGRLTTQNMVFLHIKYYACTEKWKELLILPQLNAILDIPRPSLITQYIIQAIYKTSLAQYEKQNKPDQAVGHFKEKLLSKYFSLFRTRGPIKEPNVLKAFMINLAVSDNPHQESVDKILNDCPLDSKDRPYLETLAQLVRVKEQPVEDALAKAQRIFFDGDADLALNILGDSKPNLDNTKLILICARTINSLESAKIAIDFMGKCPADARKEILSVKNLSDIWDELNSFSKPEEITPLPTDIPSNWLDWTEKLNEDSYWAAAVQVAEQGKTEWDIKEYLDNVESIDILCNLLSFNREQANNEALHNAMPHLVDFFIDEGKPHNALKKLYLKFIELIVYDDQILATDLVAIYEFASAIFKIGYSESEYNELVDYLIGVWDRKQAPNCFDWGLDTLDALINYSAPNPQIREDFFSGIISTFSQHIRRIRPEQWGLFKYLCEDLNHQDIYRDLKQKSAPPDESEAESVLPPDILANKLVGIYTLEDPVAVRVRGVLEKSFPGVKVKLDNSHAANDSLATMAREADIFIFAWRSAKHSAFDCIESNRSKEKVTLRPLGKGSSSMLRSLYEHLGIEQ